MSRRSTKAADPLGMSYVIAFRQLFADAGPESPFILPSEQSRKENFPPPDVQAQHQIPASLDRQQQPSTHMKLNDAYPSKYLTAEDLDGKDVTATIDTIDLEEIGQGADKSKKLVIGFRGKKKLFVVNKTNANTIAKVIGSDDTDDWLEQRITIGPREVEFQGNMVWSIRVSLKKPASKPAPADQDGEGDPDKEL